MAQAYDDAAFRALFPAFADETKWPEATLQMYWNVATDYISTNDNPCNMLNGQSLTLALNLMTAHIATVLNADDQNVANGGDPGTPGVIETSATIGAVSVANLPPPVKDFWDYWLAQTAYGQQLLALFKVKSVGGFSVGGLPERGGFRKVGGVFW